MQNSDNISWAGNVSHIYLEEAARDYPLTARILERYPNAITVPISDYQQVFSRPRQDFQMQKQSQKLILATKKDEFLYAGSSQCQSFGNQNFFYTTPMLNCIYNCDYCYLQGLLPSANLVLFVNTGDFTTAAADAIKMRTNRNQPLYLCISYDTDLLAFERVTGYCREWLAFAAEHKQVLIEIRTKSAAYEAISDHPPLPNAILSWTLSPDTVIRQYEKGTPPLAKRLAAVARALADGWSVRLCFDPILAIAGWQEAYDGMVKQTFECVAGDQIRDVALGVFRMGKDHFHRIRKDRLDSPLFHMDADVEEGTASYRAELREELLSFVGDRVGTHVAAEKVFVL